MKNIFFLILLVTGSVNADRLKHEYWSYGCDNYIYIFDIKLNQYKIYSRVEAHDAAIGIYTSYLLSEGALQPVTNSEYKLDGKAVDGEIEVSFSDPDLVTMQSTKYGYVALSQCDKELALKLINDAEVYFKNCPKDEIKKCP